MHVTSLGIKKYNYTLDTVQHYNACKTRVLQNTYPVRTKHCQYRLYCSDIVAYACVIEIHSRCRQILLTCVHVVRNNLVATLPGPRNPRDPETPGTAPR